MIEIKEVKSAKDVKAFATFPVKLYKDCPYYVPCIRSDEMTTFDKEKVTTKYIAAITINGGILMKLDAVICFLTLINSPIPASTVLANEVSFITMINSLPIEGKTFLIA